VAPAAVAAGTGSTGAEPANVLDGWTVAGYDTWTNPHGWPDSSNTGTSGTLTPFSGELSTSSNGQVIEDLDIDGRVEVNHSGVIIRNCRITSPGGASFPGSKCVYGGGGDLQGLLVEDCELTSANAGTYDSVIGDDNYTLRRTFIHHVPEGPRIGDNVLYEDCYFALLIGNDEEAHSDGSQVTGSCVDSTYRHNTVIAVNVDDGDQTSALLCGPDLGDVTGLVVEDNLFAAGGYTTYFGGSDFDADDWTITGNRYGPLTGDMAPTFGRLSGNIGGVTNLTWSGNVVDADNTELTLGDFV
jgi:hypothetical protein